MRIGVPKEIKPEEFRVSMTPSGVAELVRAGHSVFVMCNAGVAVGFKDVDYEAAGATLHVTLAEIYGIAELIVKVKEPQPDEYDLLEARHLLFTYLHLAANRALLDVLIAKGVTAIAYETVIDEQGRLPLLKPMSEIAGRMATQAGAHHLEMLRGGKGRLWGGIPGVAPAQVLIVGAGVVGAQAAAMAVGLGAQVTVLDKSLARLSYLDDIWRGRLVCEYADQSRLDDLAVSADLIIGSVLNAGASAPTLLNREHLRAMGRGSVLVDVAIDQGGCFASSRPTTHRYPTYIEEGVVHYCVTNIPSAVARTATLGLTNASIGYILRLANSGLGALKADRLFIQGLNTYNGALTHRAVGDAFDLNTVNAQAVLA